MNAVAPVVIAGAGPVGLVAAAQLSRLGVPVTVLEARHELSRESRASTFHPPTLDMLDDLGMAAPLVAQGRKAPKVQYRTRAGKFAEFDFGRLAGVTRHPYRLQCEQFKLTRIIYERLRTEPGAQLHFDSRVTHVQQDEDGVTVTLRNGASSRSLRASWLIGADGASSAVRTCCDIPFEGFTWPERFLVISTAFDFDSVLPDLASVSYVADPDQWHFYLRIPGHWRIMFPVPPGMSDAEATDPAYAERLIATLIPGASGCDISHKTLYKVHQRVASQFRRGRVLLAGDAAHINNPLGGMGMNGGIHDAINLANRLAAVWRGDAPPSELDRYANQRRRITLETIEKQSIQNKRDLEARDPSALRAFMQRMKEIESDGNKAYEYLLKISMISSLGRAAELG